MILRSLKTVFRDWRYVLLALLIACALFAFAVWLPNFRLIGGVLTDSTAPLSIKLLLPIALLGSIATNFTALAVSYTVAIALLAGINVALIAYFVRRQKEELARGGVAVGTFGVMSGILGMGCAACGSLILSSLLGVVGGTGVIAALPLRGGEFGIIGVVLLAISTYLILARIAKPMTCDVEVSGTSNALQRAWHNLTKYQFGVRQYIGLFLIGIAVSILIKGWPVVDRTLVAPVMPPTQAGAQLIAEAQAEVIPDAGYQSKISLGSSVLGLVENGVIDKQKFLTVYQASGGLSADLATVLTATSTKPILLTKKNANEYLNLLWPIGLANYMQLNEQSPINGKNVNNFASTGGWTLGAAQSGGVYFNKYRIIPLSPAQEERIVKLAQSMYRPCCGNSAFFQDCNHGSALLGLLELGVYEGLSDDDLYKEAVAFNSFWFPQNYTETALYFKAVKGKDWNTVDHRTIMSKDYSSLAGWSSTVDAAVRGAHLLPATTGGGSCGV